MANAQQQTAAALAQQLAQSAAPTRGSVVQPFNQGIADTGRFTDAALANLHAQIGNTAAGYTTAEGAQDAQTQAAMARLAALGGGYGAASAAAAGGMGDAAASRLLASGAAANTYANQIPGALAARGQLLQAGLIKGKQQALQNRAAAISQAFPQYLQQVQAQRLAEKQFGLSQKQVADQEHQFAVTAAQNQQRITAQENQFAKSQSQQFKEFMIQQHNTVAAAAAGNAPAGSALSGYTPNEISSLENRAAKAANDLLIKANPTSPMNMIASLVAQGIPRPIAFMETNRAYQIELANGATTPAGRAALNIARRKYVAWVRQRKFDRMIRADRNAPPKAPPGHPE